MFLFWPCVTDSLLTLYFFMYFLIYFWIPNMFSFKNFFPIIKNFGNDWENTWYSFYVMADSWWFLYSTNHAVEDTFKVCPTCTWVLVSIYMCIFKYICIYGAKPFFWVQDTNWWPEAEWFVIISNYINYINFFNFYGHVQNLLPLMVTYHPMIYLLWRWRLFSL